MKKKVIVFASIIIAAVIVFIIGGHLNPIGPAERTGYVVEINSFSNDNGVVLGIDLDNDGDADVRAETNAVVGRDIIQKLCLMHDEATEIAGIYEIKMFSPVKVNILRVIMSDGNLWERTIPKYIIMGYEPLAQN